MLRKEKKKTQEEYPANRQPAGPHPRFRGQGRPQTGRLVLEKPFKDLLIGSVGRIWIDMMIVPDGQDACRRTPSKMTVI